MVVDAVLLAGRGARVVYETENLRLGSSRVSASISDVLPAPDAR